MSRYLIRRIEENPRIVVRTRTQIAALEGNGRLERTRWRDDQTGDVETHDIGQHAGSRIMPGFSEEGVLFAVVVINFALVDSA
jgi:hypothetical protein